MKAFAARENFESAVTVYMIPLCRDKMWGGMILMF
jgi:hypothetical protein